MFAELPKLLDRDFATAYFLPMTAFFGSSLGLLSKFGFMPLLAPLLMTDTLFGVTILILVAWLGSIVLLAANRDLTRFMEGYGKYNPLRLTAWMERRRYRQLENDLSKLDDEYRQHESRSEEIGVELMLKRGRLLREAVERFPDEESWLLPTAFGNTVRAFEVYPRVMYGIESIQGWNRLLLVIPKDERTLIDSAKANVDFWLNVGLLSIAFIIEYVGVALYSREVNLVWSPLVALALAWFASYRARRNAVQWGEAVKASFDVYLGELRTKLGFPAQSNRKDERDLWTKYSQAIVFRKPKVLPESFPKDAGDAKAQGSQ